jgi:hypothetical protein
MVKFFEFDEEIGKIKPLKIDFSKELGLIYGPSTLLNLTNIIILAQNSI